MPKLRIEEAAARRQARVDRGEEAVVGVNKYRVADPELVDVLDIDNTKVRENQIAKLERVRAERDDAACSTALEALTDVECFDLAYVPQVFLPDEAFRSGIPLVWRALRPGGWVTLPVISAPGNDLGAALARLRNTLWGGGARFADEVAEAITRAGFIDVQVRHVGRTGSAIAGRRP